MGAELGMTGVDREGRGSWVGSCLSEKTRTAWSVALAPLQHPQSGCPSLCDQGNFAITGVEKALPGDLGNGLKLALGLL